MAQSDGIKLMDAGILKELVSPAAGTAKTNVSSRLCGNICRQRSGQSSRQDNTGKAKLFKAGSHQAGSGSRPVIGRFHINMNGLQIVADRGFPTPVVQQPGQDQGVDPTGNGYQHPGAIGQHCILEHGPTNTPVLSGR